MLIHLCLVCDFFCSTMAELSACNRDENIGAEKVQGKRLRLFFSGEIMPLQQQGFPHTPIWYMYPTFFCSFSSFSFCQNIYQILYRMYLPNPGLIDSINIFKEKREQSERSVRISSEKSQGNESQMLPSKY